MDIHGLSMDIREWFSSPNGTPLKLSGFQPDQSGWFVRARLCKLRVARFPLFICYEFINFRTIWGPRRFSLEAAGATTHNYGSILCYSDFSRIPQIMTNTLFKCFPLRFSTKLKGIDAESRAGHFTTIGFPKNHDVWIIFQKGLAAWAVAPKPV